MPSVNSYIYCNIIWHGTSTLYQQYFENIFIFNLKYFRKKIVRDFKNTKFDFFY